MDNTELFDKVLQFIKITDQIFSIESQKLIFNLLYKEHQIIVDVGITGSQGVSGHVEEH